MKILHSAIMLHPYVGILKQMEMEKIASIREGLNWETILFVPKDTGIISNVIKESNYVSAKKLNKAWYRIYAWFMLKIEYYTFLLKRKDVDFIMHRYSLYDIVQLFYLFLECKKVLLIHHTLEEPELMLDRSFKGRLKYFFEKITGKISLSQSFGIVGVTDELRKYELSRIKDSNKLSFVFPNGFLFNNENTEIRKRHKDNTYTLLFVASEFVEWHGLDLLLEDMKKNNRQDVQLHLVGNVYPKDLAYTEKDNRVVLHGIQNSQYINELSLECDIALASFALFRKNAYEACTLKVREYFSLGLPVYSGHKDVFNDDFKFYRVGNPILDDIVEYASLMHKESPQKIKEAAIPYLDKGAIMRNFISDLVNIKA